MKRLCLAGIVLILSGLISSNAHAQRAASLDQLRQPSAEEFLKAVLAITERARSMDLASLGLLDGIISDELIYRYLSQDQAANFPVLREVFERLMGQAGPQLIDAKAWHTALIRAWLFDNRIDLDAIRTVHFGDYHIGVTPEDFNADGARQWMLEIRDGPQSDAQTNYLVAVRTNTQFYDYHLVQTPLPWFDSALSQEGTAATFYRGDLTGDGRPEWVLTVGRILSIGGIHINYGWLEILTWRNGKLHRLAPSSAQNDLTMAYFGPSGGGVPIIPQRVTIGLTKLPNRKALQVVIHRQTADNWGCVWAKTRTFDWNGIAYSLTETQLDYPNTAECAWRHAEQAMSRNDFNRAIAHYEAGLRLMANSPANQYQRARLAIVYSLIGQRTKASALITALASETAASPVMAELSTALSKANITDPRPQTICTAAYQVFERHRQTCYGQFQTTMCSRWSQPYPGIIGMTVDDIEAYADAYNWLPAPDKAGCDPAVFGVRRRRITPVVVNPPLNTSSGEKQADPTARIRDAQRALFAGNPSAALNILGKEAVTNIAGLYLKALALEFTHQSKSALAVYRYIYMTNPDSAWGMLARLHLTVVPAIP